MTSGGVFPNDDMFESQDLTHPSCPIASGCLGKGDNVKTVALQRLTNFFGRRAATYLDIVCGDFELSARWNVSCVAHDPEQCDRRKAEITR